MSVVVPCLSWSYPSELCYEHFLSRLCWLGVSIRILLFGLDGARPHPKYIFQNNMNAMN
jgi:hypothetical protein